MTSSNPEMIQQIAAAIYAKEQEEQSKQQEMIHAMERAEVAALKEAERQARIKAEADRIEAQRRAERALAEERARVEKAEMDAAIAAELQRLRNRGPIEILQDEVASLKKTIEDMKNSQQVKMTAIVKTVVTERKFLLTCSSQSKYACGWSFNFWDSNKNIVFHFNPRHSVNLLALNTFKQNAGGWDSEDRHPLSRFDCSSGKQILFTLNEKGILISAKGSDALFYPHRMADVNIQEIVPDCSGLNDQNNGVKLTCIEL
jgi:hypothetical protein